MTLLRSKRQAYELFPSLNVSSLGVSQKLKTASAKMPKKMAQLLPETPPNHFELDLSVSMFSYPFL